MNRFVVVGAGPAGLSLALQLARSGHQVDLVEASRQFSRPFRGDALMPCGQEALARMGLGSLLEALPQRTLGGWSVWVEGRQLFQVAEPMGSLQPCRLVPQQRLLDAVLDLALQQPSLRWHPGQAVKQLCQGAGRITGVELADGRYLEADLVLGCDGRQSLLRRQADLELVEQGERLELLWFELPGPLPAAVDGGFSTHLRNGAIGSACVGAGGAWQLAWLLNPQQPTPQRTTLQWAEQLARLLPEPLGRLLQERAGELQGPVKLGVQVGLARQWRRPGLLLLGDAAHPMSPVRAQGINMALRDSLVAAQELLAEGSVNGLDAAALRVEQRRRPEVALMQRLQSRELEQGRLMARHPLLLRIATTFSPVARAIWIRRQRPLREGSHSVARSPRLDYQAGDGSGHSQNAKEPRP